MTANTDETYTFGNGVAVRRRHLLDVQVRRYTSADNGNLHEPEEEAWFLRLLADCPGPAPRFCDIGGGIGYYTLLALLQSPKLEATIFEVLPAHVSAIRENLALNDVPPDRVRLIEAAAHVAEGEVAFIDSDFSSHVVMEGVPLAKGSPFRAPARDLGAFLAEESAPFDIAKLDVQGGEAELLAHVVASGQAAKVCSWIIGTHGAALFDACREILRPHWRILHEDPAPPFQPDGLIVATQA
ncbi:FkbM family methyltransferase [Pseudoroseicyclus sp. CXY001]|uniref:FkbM family methyltransferase n=1 Tax=Pseudoroseicyclus sp. CXY001 TaxID=3242492 RepID=UPI0035711073